LVCKADVLAGFDEDHCASAVIADPYPLSALGEALALLENRRSYELRRHNDGLALWVRDHWQIGGSPASDEVIVLTDHVCGKAKLPDVKIPTVKPGMKKKGLPYDDEPPF